MRPAGGSNRMMRAGGSDGTLPAGERALLYGESESDAPNDGTKGGKPSSSKAAKKKTTKKTAKAAAPTKAAAPAPAAAAAELKPLGLSHEDAQERLWARLRAFGGAASAPVPEDLERLMDELGD